MTRMKTQALPTPSKALRRRIAADLEQIHRCQRGDHLMEATRSPGVVVCRFCHTVGVCLWCGLTQPAGACVLPCPQHREATDFSSGKMP